VTGQTPLAQTRGWEIAGAALAAVVALRPHLAQADLRRVVIGLAVALQQT
jgi:hypothetical protein